MNDTLTFYVRAPLGLDAPGTISFRAPAIRRCSHTLLVGSRIPCDNGTYPSACGAFEVVVRCARVLSVERVRPLSDEERQTITRRWMVESAPALFDLTVFEVGGS